MVASKSTLRRYEELKGKTFALGVGAMKCGTSWVNAYLASLKDVTASPLKEVHFFDSKFPGLKEDPTNERAFERLSSHIERIADPVKGVQSRPHFQSTVDRIKMIYDDNAYFDHFARICTDETKTLTELTPAYATIGEDGFRYVKDFFRSQDVELKIFFLMREPVDRLWSHFRFMAERNPKHNILVDWKRFIEQPRIMERSDYKATIDALDTVFDDGTVEYFFYENMLQEETLQNLCRFVGAEFEPPKSAEARNKTSVDLAMTEEIESALRTTLQDQLSYCEDRFGSALPVTWRG